MATVNTLTGLVNGALAEKGVTKAELASALGISSYDTLGKKLDGTSGLSLFEAKALARFCDISVDELCTLVYGN